MSGVEDYFRSLPACAENPSVAGALLTAKHKAPLIIGAVPRDHASDPLASATLRIVKVVWGAAADNFKRNVCASGGPAPQLTEGALRRAVPIHVVNVNATLIGAAFMAWSV